mmetsp:Transcript_52252/g.62949  ORF Transcript_52252/g.62949 Transcript_52252/m.62949 type:complete len:238 (+) Transcript_52252:123-836(+)
MSGITTMNREQQYLHYYRSTSHISSHFNKKRKEAPISLTVPLPTPHNISIPYDHHNQNRDEESLHCYDNPRVKRRCTRIEDFSMGSSPHGDKRFGESTTCQFTEVKVDWWKRKKIGNDGTAGDNDLHRCFVCQKVPVLKSRPKSTQTNSILSYFSSSRPLSITPALNRQGTGGSLLSPCSFCERNACGDCNRKCKACNGVFCNFCSIVDFDGVIEEIFCLDCNRDDHVHNVDEMALE